MCNTKTLWKITCDLKFYFYFVRSVIISGGCVLFFLFLFFVLYRLDAVTIFSCLDALLCVYACAVLLIYSLVFAVNYYFSAQHIRTHTRTIENKTNRFKFTFLFLPYLLFVCGNGERLLLYYYLFVVLFTFFSDFVVFSLVPFWKNHSCNVQLPHMKHSPAIAIHTYDTTNCTCAKIRSQKIARSQTENKITGIIRNVDFQKQKTKKKVFSCRFSACRGRRFELLPNNKPTKTTTLKNVCFILGDLMEFKVCSFRWATIIS